MLEVISMEDFRRKKLELILWHLDDIGKFLSRKSLFPEAIDRLCYFATYGMIGTYVVDEATKNCTFKDIQPIIPQEKRQSVPGLMDQDPLCIFPFVNSDAAIHPNVAMAMRRISGAAYSPAQDCIFLNLEHMETDRYMATSILHEAGHAIKASEQDRLYKPSNRPVQERVQEELEMWLFDCKLAQTLGGDKLRREMHQTIAEITKPGAAGTIQGFRPGIGKSLDLCYRPVAGREERGGRDKLYWTFCQLLAAQRLPDPVSSHQRQLEVMKAVCGRYYAEGKELLQQD